MVKGYFEKCILFRFMPKTAKHSNSYILVVKHVNTYTYVYANKIIFTYFIGFYLGKDLNRANLPLFHTHTQYHTLIHIDSYQV